MTTLHANPDQATDDRRASVDLKLEVVVLPVSDVDRAKDFYAMLGWRLDADFAAADGFRVVQLTPPGSPASIIVGSGITAAAPGSVRELQLVVADVDAARSELAERGVEVSEVFHDRHGVFHHAGGDERVAGPDPERRSYGSFASFADPDGNTWVLQEVTARAPGRIEEAAYRSAGDLSAALRRAAIAHGEHERRTGQPDPDWPDWYAASMVAERTGAALPS